MLVSVPCIFEPVDVTLLKCPYGYERLKNYQNNTLTLYNELR